MSCRRRWVASSCLLCECTAVKCVCQVLDSSALHMQDDLLIKAEGLDSLTDDELRTACKARGLKAAYGEGATMYMRKQMQVGH